MDILSENISIFKTQNGLIYKYNLKLILLVIFNVIDAISTYLGIKYGIFIELNPLMINIASNFEKLFILKILLVTMLLFLIGLFINTSKQKLTLVKFFITFTFAAYLLLMFNHIIQLSLWLVSKSL